MSKFAAQEKPRIKMAAALKLAMAKHSVKIVEGLKAHGAKE
jgi:hypothetical protein